MSALTILIIRHAEKPEEPPDQELGVGVSRIGAAQHGSLVVRGWQRAGTWAALFASGAFGPDYPKPSLIYAANPDKPAPGETEISHRPWETILPLCARLHIDPITDFAVGDEKKLVKAVMVQTGIVLVAWEHKSIVAGILPALAKGQPTLQLPTKWKSDRFDVVFRFDRAQEGAKWTFRQLFPMFLSGDSDVPLKDAE
jgi:hypothetical protein